MTPSADPSRHGHAARDGRVAIVAGGGALPGELAAGLSLAARPPFLVIIEDQPDTDPDLFRFEHRMLKVEDYGTLISILRRAEATHVVLAGAISRRPALRSIRWNFSLLKVLPTVVAGLARGDDAILRAIVRHLEAEGFNVLGAHEILPDLIAREGQISQVKPSTTERRNIAAAMEAARAIGALDIGQAAIAVRGRVVALEGAEGTAEMIDRVRRLRTEGRIGKAGGVLVKCAKPNQELRADLPSIGPDTVRGVHAAGLAGIAVEAGRAIVLQRKQVIELADELGIFVTGIAGGTP
ncbi:LpxI family protein [Aquibium oceanicum]|uniref:DUF1009 domain-containing protein n=1 Tax=Aquibium oceanicum TaxID=1670800 RepID=A0A1L3SSR4_9HYPH|nr:UDP-2,3-diacylglucosamine diphosphatase LpxI [Aquibium oceanicum]APH72473.1 hypothetical protein BSQ44_14725 [Aquibium oceanicum]